MNGHKKITINVPIQLFEKGLTEAQVDGSVNRWLVTALFQQGNMTAAEAGQLLDISRDGFLSMLDEGGILYEDVPADGSQSPRVSPQLAELTETQERLKALEKDLIEANKQLRQADRVRGEFMATFSHELRAPLNSIIGFAKLLLNQRTGTLDETQQADLTFIYNSAQHVLSLVDDISDLSKIDAGRSRLKLGWATIEEIVEGVIAYTSILVEDKSIELKEKIEPDLPKIYVDKGRIRQVVFNLLSNAAKFTDAGRITLRIYKTVKNGQDFICFSITDTGIGIAKADRSKVFETFQQIDTPGRRAEGSGLGIPISDRLVKLHGGELWFDSTIGQGSTFYFTIPIQAPESSEADVGHADIGQ